MTEEAQVFRGDGPTEAEASVAGQPKARPAPQTIVSKNDLPAGEPVGDHHEAEPAADFAEPVAEVAAARAYIEPEPEYDFEIDPESLWTMPEEMKERLSNLGATITVLHQQLDDQERETARIAKALRALQ